ncbi:hypothetical protein DFH06DRAFT_1159175 [Mycena polygramma]|nr:hypothetical protein DFH06DRAFT_1159175 [Mycena polygramma]
MLSPFAPASQTLLGGQDPKSTALNPLVHRLPVELTAEFFLHCLPENDFVVPRSTTAPLLLCHTVRRWRNIALATPRLWSSLYLNFNCFRMLARFTERDGVDFFSSWIRNAGNTSLSIEIRPPPGDVYQPDVQAVLAIIGERAAQWKNMRLWFSIQHFYLRDIFPIDKDFPRLEKLLVDKHFVLSPPRFFALLPRLDVLRELHLDHFDEPTVLTAAQWTQITAFSATDILFSHCLDVLEFGRNLVRCIFHVAPTHFGLEPEELRTVTSNLQVLTLNESRSSSAPLHMVLLQCLTLPSLKRLQLHFIDDSWPNPRNVIPGFALFAPQFSQQLQELSIRYIPLRADTLVECLATVPSVAKLTLYPWLMFNIAAVFDDLGSMPDLLPNLTSLHTRVGYDRTAGSHLVDMLCVRARRPDGGAGLRSVRLLNFINDELAGDIRFQRLIDEGMDIGVDRFGSEQPAPNQTGLSEYFGAA